MIYDIKQTDSQRGIMLKFHCIATSTILCSLLRSVQELFQTIYQPKKNSFCCWGWEGGTGEAVCWNPVFWSTGSVGFDDHLASQDWFLPHALPGSNPSHHFPGLLLRGGLWARTNPSLRTAWRERGFCQPQQYFDVSRN